MITNIGSNRSVFCCMHRHSDPIPMVIKEGNNQFYACPKYMLKDSNHPDGYDPEFEHACNNRLSFDEAGDVIMKVSEIMEEAYNNGEFTDWTNFSFKVKNIQAKVLKYTDKKIEFGVVNTKVTKADSK